MSNIKIEKRVMEDNSIKISILKNNVSIGQGYIQQYPGCCGICIMYNVSIMESFQGEGLGKRLVKNIIETARIQNYTILKATVNQYSPNMHHILKLNGFAKVTEFTNRKTSNLVSEYQLNLQ